MFASPEARQQALANVQRWIATLPPHEGAYLTELISAESGWEPEAESGTGARGLTQFIKGTWNDTIKFLQSNPDAVDLPAGLTPEKLADYESQWGRPLASSVMALANTKRIEQAALHDVNRARLRNGAEDVTSLLDAVDNDPRKWATVVATGHKDGQSRAPLWFDETGQFSPEAAIAFYKEQNTTAQGESSSLRDRAQALLADGNEGAADALFQQARQTGNSDANGHVFGYADRISNAVAGATGNAPLEYTRDQVQEMYDLRIPGSQDTNPNVVGFRGRLDTGQSLVEAEPAGTAIDGPSPAAGQAPAVEAATFQPQTRGEELGANVRALPGQFIEGARAGLSQLGDSIGNVVGGGLDRAGEFLSGINETAERDLAQARADVARTGAEQVGQRGGFDDFVRGIRGDTAEGEIARLTALATDQQAVADGLNREIAGLPPVSGEQVTLDDVVNGLNQPAIPTGLPPSLEQALASIGQPAPAAPDADPLGVGDFAGATFRDSQGEQNFDRRAANLNAQADALQAQDDERSALLAALAVSPDVSLPQNTGALDTLMSGGVGQRGLGSDLDFQPSNFNTTPIGDVAQPSARQVNGVLNVLEDIGSPEGQAAARQRVLQNLMERDPAEALNLTGLRDVGLDPFRPLDQNLDIAEQLQTNQLRSEGVNQGLNIFDQIRDPDNASLLGLSRNQGLRDSITELTGRRLANAVRNRRLNAF